MLYFLYGESSYHALRKISDFKNAFKKKSADFLIEDFDGETEELSFGQFHASLGQQNLFSGTRLVIYRNVLGEDEKLFEELVNNADYFKSIKDVFVFWEREPETKTLNFFKKYSEKTQEIKDVTDVELDKFYGNASKQEKKHGPAPTPFAFIDKMFGPRAPLALKEMSLAGIEPQKFIYAFLWKLKQKSGLARRLFCGHRGRISNAKRPQKRRGNFGAIYFFPARPAGGDKSLDNLDFILAALLTLIICFLADLSAILYAKETAAAVFSVSAFFIASFNLSFHSRFTVRLFSDCLSAFLADFVIAIGAI